MKKILLIAVAAFVSVSVYAQGTVNFSTLGKTITQAPDAPYNGDVVPAGSTFMGALYYAPLGVTDMSAFMQVGAPAGFLAAGTIIGGTRTAPLTPPGATANFQVRVWEVATGADWDAALHRGESNIFPVDTGDPTTVPPGTAGSMAAMQSFQMYVVPEPSVFALGALGAGALLLLRRRNK